MPKPLSREDANLLRMLKTPPKPHAPLKAEKSKAQPVKKAQTRKKRAHAES
jgi:hypothetical protein